MRCQLKRSSTADHRQGRQRCETGRTELARASLRQNMGGMWPGGENKPILTFPRRSPAPDQQIAAFGPKNGGKGCLVLLPVADGAGRYIGRRSFRSGWCLCPAPRLRRASPRRCRGTVVSRHHPSPFGNRTAFGRNRARLELLQPSAPRSSPGVTYRCRLLDTPCCSAGRRWRPAHIRFEAIARFCGGFVDR